MPGRKDRTDDDGHSVDRTPQWNMVACLKERIMHNCAVVGNFLFPTSLSRWSGSTTSMCLLHCSHRNQNWQRGCLWRRVLTSTFLSPRGGRSRKKKRRLPINRESPSCSMASMPGSIRKEALERGARVKTCSSSSIGNALEHPESVSGTDYAVCYLDLQWGTFSNAVWKVWFSSNPTTILEGSDQSTITFLGLCVQFHYTTHYTVIAADGHVHEYTDSAGAVQGFQTLPPREVSSGSQVQTIFPQFCYYHEVTCPSGVYRIEFFGPRGDEQGYQVKEAEGSGQTSPGQMILSPLASPIWLGEANGEAVSAKP